MKFKNVLLLYKRSAYRIYFMDKQSTMRTRKNKILQEEFHHFERAHEEHYRSLRTISKVLLTHGIRYTEIYRGRKVDYSRFDLIITVGGDGTFLEAARRIKNQLMIGVNSAPSHSVGRFCITDAQNFLRVIELILKDKFEICRLQRLRLAVDEHVEPVEALNDVLICHANPAVLCRYALQIKDIKENQRSSGIWVSTPVGSSGAIQSAGGKLLNPFEKKFQYMPRELYLGSGTLYRLKGGVLDARQRITVTSLMRRGMIFVDGAHVHYPFEYGATLKVSLSPHPIRTIQL